MGPGPQGASKSAFCHPAPTRSLVILCESPDSITYTLSLYSCGSSVKKVLHLFLQLKEGGSRGTSNQLVIGRAGTPEPLACSLQ